MGAAVEPEDVTKIVTDERTEALEIANDNFRFEEQRFRTVGIDPAVQLSDKIPRLAVRRAQERINVVDGGFGCLPPGKIVLITKLFMAIIANVIRREEEAFVHILAATGTAAVGLSERLLASCRPLRLTEWFVSGFGH